MSNPTTNRQPKGTPVGGQFAQGRRAAADASVTLDEAPAQDAELAEHRETMEFYARMASHGHRQLVEIGDHYVEITEKNEAWVMRAGENRFRLFDLNKKRGDQIGDALRYALHGTNPDPEPADGAGEGWLSAAGRHEDLEERLSRGGPAAVERSELVARATPALRKMTSYVPAHMALVQVRPTGRWKKNGSVYDEYVVDMEYEALEHPAGGVVYTERQLREERVYEAKRLVERPLFPGDEEMVEEWVTTHPKTGEDVVVDAPDFMHYARGLAWHKRFQEEPVDPAGRKNNLRPLLNERTSYRTEGEGLVRRDGKPSTILARYTCKVPVS